MRSIVLAVLALVSTGVGVLATPVPVVGTVFSWGAPALAVTGLILGGMDYSRRKRAGQSSDGPIVGVMLSAFAFFPAFAFALTCGLCNAFMSASPIQMRRDVRFNVRDPRSQQQPLADGGTPTLPPPFAPGFGAPGDAGIAPAPGSAPVIPPPPLPAGPRSP